MPQAIVAILGGTGDLGLHISKVFLTEYGSQFPTVRVTTRDVSSPKAQELAKLGAELHSFSDSVDSLLAGVDVVVDSLPIAADPEYRKKLLDAVIRHKIKAYFLSEYGVNYNLNDFPGYEHPEWVRKRGVNAGIRETLQGKTKVIALHVGMFFGWFFLPGLGIDIEKNVYTPLGSASNHFAATAESDIGRAIAQIALLVLDPATAATVRDVLRIASQNPTFEEIRDAVARAKGLPKGEIRVEDLSATKEALRANPTRNITDYVRILIGEGKLDYSQNDNELVNPGQKLWKWKTLEDHLRGMA